MVSAEIMLDAQELPPLTWSSAAAAFMWAEETASRPNYKSPLGAMQGRIIGDDVSGWSPEDYRDLAYSILTVVANLEDNQAREVFRYIYSISSQKQTSLASLFGEQLQAKYANKTYWQMKQVAEVALMRARFSAQHRKRLGIGFYARALGVQRPSLYSGGWQVIIADTESDIQSVLNRGNGLAKIALERLRVLS